MIHLHLVPETPADGPAFGCAEIRLLRPYQHPSLARLLTVTAGPALPSGRLDVVVVQRGGTVGCSLADVVGLVKAVHERGARLIYDLDDNILDPHPVTAVERSLAQIRAPARYFLREADLVTVSTAGLAERVAALSPRVALWENAIDETLVVKLGGQPAPDRVDLGYFGTLSHMQDLMAVAGPLEAAAAKSGSRPIFELCGLTDDDRVGGLFAHSMSVALRPVEARYERFHAMLAGAGWKVGLAPLLPGIFNDAKSDIKVLDYAAAGIPAVVTDVPAYAGLADGEIVLRATIDTFGEVALGLLADAPLRDRLVRNARDYLLSERSLAVCAPRLGELVESVLATAPRTARPARQGREFVP